MLIFLMIACADRPDALVLNKRDHWLDRPWPSDEVVVDGFVDWTLLGDAPSDLGQRVVGGWAAQAAGSVRGASHQPAIYFRFEETFDITRDDIGLIDSKGKSVPLEWWWIDDPKGDPWLAKNTLILMPEPTSPLKSGERYVAYVSDKVADKPSKDYEPPKGTPDHVAVATAFTVQDSLGQLRTLRGAVDAALDDNPGFLASAEWKEVVHLRYEQGKTPSGKDATVSTVTYDDGTTDLTYVYPIEGQAPLDRDLTDDWPYQVLEGRITTVAFQGLADQPWATGGVGLLNDFQRYDEGWIHFDDRGELSSPWEPESMRVIVQIPRDGTGPFPVVTYDHGTGGHAYSAVSRIGAGDMALEVAEAFSEAVLVSRDQPLYGQRYPLMDKGFSASLGFYNIGNLPCFRDNQRQAAADHRVMMRFVQDQLPSLASVDTARVGAFGHSLGSVTAHGALVAQGNDGQASSLMSGSGGYLTYYVLETGLLDQDNDLILQVAPLLGLTPDDLAAASASELVGALVGLPESAWGRIDRYHPVMQLFQSIMDPSDPLMLVAHQTVPETILLGVDDYQVPNATTEWLGEVHADAEIDICERTSDYDGHLCTFRETKGFDAIREFVAGL